MIAAAATQLRFPINHHAQFVTDPTDVAYFPDSLSNAAAELSTRQLTSRSTSGLKKRMHAAARKIPFAADFFLLLAELKLFHVLHLAVRIQPCRPTTGLHEKKPICVLFCITPIGMIAYERALAISTLVAQCGLRKIALANACERHTTLTGCTQAPGPKKGSNNQLLKEMTWNR